MCRINKRKKALICALVLLIVLIDCRIDVFAFGEQIKMAKKVEIVLGKSKTLKVQGTNILSKKFKSSNKKIATVTQKGKVTAKKVGKVHIIVNVAFRKSKVVKMKELRCVVTIRKPALQITPAPVPSILNVTPRPENSTTPVTIPKEDNKNIKDVVALTTLIQEQKEAGAVISGDINNDVYGWEKSVTGEYRLKKINWKECRLSGDISFSGLPALREIVCTGNYITDIDVSGCKSLVFLNCEKNQISALDIKKNKNMATLICGINQLTELDVSQNTKLISLWCQGNYLKHLDVSQNKKLMVLQCWKNRLLSLDVSENDELEDLCCSSNQISELNVQNNKKLTELNCTENLISELDVSNNIELQELACSYNQLETIDIKSNPHLVTFYCTGNVSRK